MKKKRVLFFLLVMCLLVFSGCGCDHKWMEADCVTPKTCELCGEIEGEAMGHSWNEATCETPKHCALCGETEGEALGHSWMEATCETAKVCEFCGAAEGEPLGHNWLEATCTQARTCETCDKIDGEPLTHEVSEWALTTAATCQTEGTQSGVCSLCETTIEETVAKLEHTKSDWTVTREATSSENGIRQILCQVCAEVLQEEEFELSEEEKIELYKSECQEYSFDTIARNPDSYIGEKGYVRGEVIQVVEDGDDYTLRVNMTKGRYYWDDTILVVYTRQSSSEDRILEDDIVKMYGTWAGTYTYETVMGASLTVPLFFCKYLEIE